ncbi:MAG TPA: RNA polymerase sigma factor [Chthoniobacterales bacterium]|nr:RNA polymerase sigma factor [Chthoniobacterales bacterium]
MAAPDFQQLVDAYYEPLYRFALSLARNETDAADLVQQTYSQWARKGHQLRDPDLAKTWLFTTLRREFLGTLRKSARYSDEPPTEGEASLDPEQAESLDAAEVMECLQKLPLEYREPLVLFYLRDVSYSEIAEILEVPVGTVMSRLSRGKTRLRAMLSNSNA